MAVLLSRLGTFSARHRFAVLAVWLLVLVAGGVGGRAQARVFGMGVFGGAACGSAERGGQRRPVIGPVGVLREPAGVSEQLR